MQQGLTDPQEIYALGARKLDEVLEWCAEPLDHGGVTLCVLSTDSLGRLAAEVSGILATVESKLRSLAKDPQIHHRCVRVGAIGRLDLLAHSTIAAVNAARDATARHGSTKLTIAVAYDGRQEIVDAVRALLEEEARKASSLADATEQITTTAISQHLYTACSPDPDMIIRTSGEIRLSGFLIGSVLVTR